MSKKITKKCRNWAIFRASKIGSGWFKFAFLKASGLVKEEGYTLRATNYICGDSTAFEVHAFWAWWKCHIFDVKLLIFSVWMALKCNSRDLRFFDKKRVFRGPLAPTKRVANRKRLKEQKLCENALHEKSPFERFIRHFDWKCSICENPTFLMEIENG